MIFYRVAARNMKHIRELSEKVQYDLKWNDSRQIFFFACMDMYFRKAIYFSRKICFDLEIAMSER